MKILFATDGIFPDFVGGMPRHSYFLVDYLARLDLEIDVVHPTKGTEYFGGHDNVREFVAEQPKTVHYLRTCYAYADRIADFLEGREYDAAYGQGFTLIKHASRSPYPCIYNPHGLEMFQTMDMVNTLKALPFRHMARKTGRRSEITISLGGKLTNIINKKMGIPKESIRVIPNGVSMDYIIDVQRAKTEPGDKLPNSFLFVGRLAYNKGLTFLMDALELMPEEDVTIYIVGGGPMEAELKERADERVTFLGKVSDEELFEWYGRAECFLLPTLYEGMPTVILEAMACGVPVIASDIGAVSTMVTPETGLLINPGRSAEIAGALRKFAGKPAAEKDRMGKTAKKYIAERFDWTVIARNTFELLEELAAR